MKAWVSCAKWISLVPVRPVRLSIKLLYLHRYKGGVNCCLLGSSRAWGEEAEPGTCVQLLEQTQCSDQVVTSLFLLCLGCVLETIIEACASPSARGQRMCMVQSFPCCRRGQRPGLQVLPILPWDSGPHCCGKTACAFLSCAGKAAPHRVLLCLTATVAPLLFIYICRKSPGKKVFGFLVSLVDTLSTASRKLFCQRDSQTEATSFFYSCVCSHLELTQCFK